MKLKNIKKTLKKAASKLGKVVAPALATVLLGPIGGKVVSLYSGVKKYTSVIKSGDTKKQAVRAGAADLGIGLATTYLTAGIMKPSAESALDSGTGETDIGNESMAGYVPIQAGYEKTGSASGPGLKTGSPVKWILLILAVIAALWLLVKYQPWKHLKLATA